MKLSKSGLIKLINWNFQIKSESFPSWKRRRPIPRERETVTPDCSCV